jgi:regulation of enolase protein 1 (concanavalin A-like superfamily)
MAQNVYIGLAVSANNNSALVTATFDGVSITTATGDFALSALPGSLSIYQGASGTSTVTITPQNGFSDSVSLSASGLPSGVTASFSPNPATATSTLTLAASGTATTGTVTVTITGTSGSLTHTTTVNLTVNVAPNFPPGWLDADVGSVGTAGSASYANGTFTVKASGKWIWDVADGMHFVYQSFSGNGTIVARVVSVQGSTYPEAGVMIRETLGANSAHAYTAYEPYPGPSIYLYSRASTGGTTASQSSAVSGLPYWVKLVRSGSTFSGYASSDGVNWVQVGSSRTISMSQNVYIGLAVSANNNSALVTATFDNVSITVPVPDFALLASPGNLSIMQGASGTSTVTITPQNGFSGSVSLSASGVPSGVTASFSPNPTTATSTLTLAASGTATTGTATVAITGTSGSLTHTTTVNLTVNVAPNFPPGWLEADVGSVGTAGSASYANGAFTVKASGKWIWDVADGMHFVYQAFSGDGTIVARVVSAQGSVYPQAGVMIRETLATGSVHAHAAYQPYPGPSVYFYSRASSGGTTVAQGTAVSGLPYWVKLVRSGSTFSSYASANGVNWVQLGSSRTINMSQNVYIGLAVSANNNSALVTATFDNVSID